MSLPYPIPAPSPLWAAPRYDQRGAALVALLNRAMTADLDDVELMQRAAGGDAPAYRELSDRYLAQILRYTTRVLGDESEAEDVAQETFLRMWKQADRWQPNAKLTTWLHRIAHNLCIDHFRKKRPDPSEGLDRHSAGDRPSGLLERKRLASEVQAALDALPERQRAAMVLSHYQGMSNPEAAEVLEVSVEAVESLLSRARRALRDELSHLQGTK